MPVSPPAPYRFRNAILCARFRADEDFLHAFFRLGHGLETAGNLALDADGAGGVGGTEGFSAVGAPDDHAAHALQRLDAAQYGLAFPTGRLVASARWHDDIASVNLHLENVLAAFD